MIYFIITLRAPVFVGVVPLMFLLTSFIFVFSPPVYVLIKYLNTEYIITDRRIITKTGVLKKDIMSVDLSKVIEVYVEVSFIDKMCGTGTVYAKIASLDTSVLESLKEEGYDILDLEPRFESLREPYKVQELLQSASSRAVVYCSKCGDTIPTDNKVCPRCGNMITDRSSSQT